MKFRSRTLAVLIISFGLGAGAAAQDVFPGKPLTVINGFPPGGVSDATLRYLTESAGRRLGQPILVRYKAGASGIPALIELHNSPADGYTLSVLSTGGIISSNMQKLAVEPAKDFSPVIQMGEYVLGLAVQATSPYQSLADLIADARANPGKVSYATSGPGSPQHLVMAELGEKNGVTFTHVPATGGPAAVNLLLGGHVTAVSQGTDWKPHVESGKLRLLAVYSRQRLKEFPQVPTLLEAGGPAGIPSIWTIVAPTGVPAERLMKIHDAFRLAMEEPGYKTLCQTFTFRNEYAGPEELQKKYDWIHSRSAEILASVPK